MGEDSKKLMSLPPGEKRLIILRMFCNEHLGEFCISQGLAPDDVSLDTFMGNTLGSAEVVEALVEGLEIGLGWAAKKILEQRAEAAEAVGFILDGSS